MNVKFYSLGQMQAWTESYEGIFVHLTTQSTVSDVTYKPGLYFGGHSGWEYLTNDTAAISDAITAAIGNLDGSATIASVSNNVVTLKAGVVEADGVINNSSDSDIVLEEVAVTGAAADVSTTAITDGQATPTQLYAAGTVQGTLEAIARDLSNAVNDVTMDGTSVVNSHTAALLSDEDSAYDASTNKLATVGTVTNAINALDVTDVEIASISALSNASGVEVTLHDIKQTDGLIAQGSDNSDTKTFTVGDGQLTITGYYTDGSDADSTFDAVGSTAIFSANQTSGSEIALDKSLILNTNGTHTEISVRTKSAVSESNLIVTEQDIAQIAGAMHYKGGLVADANWPSTVAAGDVYMVTTGFTHGSDTLEAGDMIVFNSTTTSDYKVVQSNMTLGVGAGQVATNDGALTADKIVLATANGIATSGYGVADLASQATAVAGASGLGTGESGVTITDTLTVGSIAQTGQVVTLKSGNNAIAVSNSGNTITLTHITPSSFTAPSNAAVKITTDNYGHITATTALVAGDISITDSDNHFTTDTVQGAIDELYTISGQHSTVSSNDGSIAVTTGTNTGGGANYNVELVWRTTLA